MSHKGIEIRINTHKQANKHTHMFETHQRHTGYNNTGETRHPVSSKIHIFHLEE